MRLHNHPAKEEKARRLGCLDNAHVIVDTVDWAAARHPAVTLSRRNLLCLLHELEVPGSYCTTLLKPNGVAVTVESDEIHYANRPGGRMHPKTAAFVREMETALALVRHRRATDDALAERANKPKVCYGCRNCNCGGEIA